MSDNRNLPVIQPQESSAPAANQENPVPEFRFENVAPGTVTLKLKDFWSSVPEPARRGLPDPEREIRLSSSEIFSSLVPQVSLSTLARVAPDVFVTEGNPNARIKLPAARLAKNYRFISRKVTTSGASGQTVIEQPDPETKRAAMLAATAEAARKMFRPANVPESAQLVPTEVARPREIQVAVPEIPHPEKLQDILMTEEDLTVKRVVELCGELPGISSVVLANKGEVVSSYKAPTDIVALSANAMEMLKTMQASSAKMGLGDVPAITIHSDKGPVSLVNRDNLYLILVHKDRGFVPGVREKLQDVLGELAQASLPPPNEIRNLQ